MLDKNFNVVNLRSYFVSCELIVFITDIFQILVCLLQEDQILKDEELV